MTILSFFERCASRFPRCFATSSNNLKELLLAMYYYQDEHKHFPGPAITRSSY